MAYRFAVTQPALVGLTVVVAVALLPLGPLAMARAAVGGLLLLELALINQLLAACAQARLAALGLGTVTRTLVAVAVLMAGWTAVLWGRRCRRTPARSHCWPCSGSAIRSLQLPCSRRWPAFRWGARR